jgi:hypothetical protein
MMDQVSCKECGVSISPDTAEDFDGLCASCRRKSNTYVFRDAGKLTKWVRIALYAQVAIAAVALVSGYMEYQTLTRLVVGLFPSQQHALTAVQASDSRESVVALVQLAVAVVSGVLILTWIYRANRNARSLGAKDMQYTPGWSVGWYFVPVAMLWKPYQAMKEIWKASHQPVSWKDAKVGGIVHWWWFLWIASGVAGQVAFRLQMNAKTLEDLLNANIAFQVSNVVDIPLAIGTLLLVNRIFAAQWSRSEGVADQGPSRFHSGI